MNQWPVLVAAVWAFARKGLSFENLQYTNSSTGQVDQWSPSKIDHPLLQTLKTYEVFHPRQYEDYQHRRRKSNVSTAIANEIGLHAEIAYFAFEFQGKTHNLDASINQVLLPQSFSVIDISGTGKSTVHKPTVHEQNHCYYQGKIRDVSGSQVIMSTCHGLKGCIILPDDFFIFEPLSVTTAQLNQDTPHVIYRSKDVISNKPNGTCGQNGSQSDLHSFVNNLKQHSPESTDEISSRKNRDTTLPKRYIELLFVVDFALVTRLGNSTVIESHVKEVANYVDGFYQLLGAGIRVVLSSVEVWSQADRINVERIADHALNNLIDFRKNQSSTEPSTSVWVYADTVHLLHGGFFNGTLVGLASVDTMCTKSSCGVNEDTDSDGVLHVANTVAHEMAHNLGLMHDTDQCTCPTDADCIMAPAIGLKPKKDWSDCSRSYLEQNRKSGTQKCLYNVPSPSRVYLGPQCGNGIVEKNEECDCGTPQFCKSLCCNASTCQFLPGVACDFGLCCKECQYTSAGTECRGTKGNECDFPELCTGLSADCPDNVYLENGLPCQNDTAFCADGVCRTHESQCQAIWGPTATVGPSACYDSINKAGTDNGNCGQSGSTFLKCSAANAICGKLVCVGGGDFPVFAASFFLNNLKLSTDPVVYKCKTLRSAIGTIDEPGLVVSGTKCGPGKVCQSGVCSQVKPLTCSDSCNGNEKCDTLGNCQCPAGFSSPGCKAVDNGANKGDGSQTETVDSKNKEENIEDDVDGKTGDTTNDDNNEGDATNDVNVSSKDGENDNNGTDFKDSDNGSASSVWQRSTIISGSIVFGALVTLGGGVLTYIKVHSCRTRTSRRQDP